MKKKIDKQQLVFYNYESNYLQFLYIILLLCLRKWKINFQRIW